MTGRQGHNAARAGTGEVGFQARTTTPPTCSELDESSGVRWVGQFVTSADMAVEADNMRMNPGDVALFCVDADGCSTGGMAFLDGDGQGVWDGQIGVEAQRLSGEYGQGFAYVAIDIDGSKLFGSVSPPTQVPASPTTQTVEDDRPWSWETIAEEFDPNIADMLRTEHGNVGSAIAAWTITPASDRRHQLVAHLNRTGETIRRALHDEIAASAPVGTAIPLPGVTSRYPGHTIVSLPTGATVVYPDQRVPDDATIERWRQMHTEADRRLRDALSYQPSIVATSDADDLVGCTLGNRHVVAQDERLRRNGLLDDREWAAGRSLRDFWATPGRPDDAWPTVAEDGTIFDANGDTNGVGWGGQP